MRRVITVSLSGNAFALDEDAYERLRAYWASVESRSGASAERQRLLAEMEKSVADQIVASRPQTNDSVVSDATMVEVLSNLGATQNDPTSASMDAANAPTSESLSAHSTARSWEAQESEYTRLPVFVLCLFLGWFGLHRMFVGKIGTGLLQLVTIGGLGIWTLYDLILILFASFRDSEGRRIVRWA